MGWIHQGTGDAEVSTVEKLINVCVSSSFVPDEQIETGSMLNAAILVNCCFGCRETNAQVFFIYVLRMWEFGLCLIG